MMPIVSSSTAIPEAASLNYPLLSHRLWEKDQTKDADKKNTLRDCASLAMQDHAIQDQEGLYLFDLVKVKSKVAFEGNTYYTITFRGASNKHGVATYEADLWNVTDRACQDHKSPCKGK